MMHIHLEADGAYITEHILEQKKKAFIILSGNIFIFSFQSLFFIPIKEI